MKGILQSSVSFFHSSDSEGIGSIWQATPKVSIAAGEAAILLSMYYGCCFGVQGQEIIYLGA